MSFNTQMTLALLQELLLALRANDPDALKGWLSLGIQDLGEPAVTELLLDWINPILTTDEADMEVVVAMGVAVGLSSVLTTVKLL